MSDTSAKRSRLDDLQVIGWIEAAAFVIALSMLNVLYAYALAKGANVIVFVLYALIGASVAMLAVSGIGGEAWAIIKTPQSWIYGGASVALEAIYFLLVGLISPAEASLPARLSGGSCLRPRGGRLYLAARPGPGWPYPCGPGRRHWPGWPGRWHRWPRQCPSFPAACASAGLP